MWQHFDPGWWRSYEMAALEQKAQSHLIKLLVRVNIFTWTARGSCWPRLHWQRAGPQTAGRPCSDMEATELPHLEEPSAPSQCPGLQSQWRDWSHAPLATQKNSITNQDTKKNGSPQQVTYCKCTLTIGMFGPEQAVITLAGLIPIMPPLALFCLWMWWSWQILSFSSWAVSSAAARTASPLPRPFTSAALMAATSLDPHALKNKSSESLWGKLICFGQDFFFLQRNMQTTSFYLPKINTFQWFSQYLQSGTGLPSKVKPRTFLFFRRYTAALLLINPAQTKSRE